MINEVYNVLVMNLIDEGFTSSSRCLLGFVHSPESDFSKTVSPLLFPFKVFDSEAIHCLYRKASPRRDAPVRLPGRVDNHHIMPRGVNHRGV